MYFVDQYLKSNGDSFEGKNVVVHGSGNVAIYAVQKVSQLGGKVLACSDTKGWVEDPEGIDYQVLEHVYNKKRSGHDKGVSLAMYVDERPNATWHEGDGRGVWQLPCDIALPCARENTLPRRRQSPGGPAVCRWSARGAGMPTTLDATEYLQENGVAFTQGRQPRRVAASLRPACPEPERRAPTSWTLRRGGGPGCLEQLMVVCSWRGRHRHAKYGHENAWPSCPPTRLPTPVADAMIRPGHEPERRSLAFDRWTLARAADARYVPNVDDTADRASSWVAS